MPRLRKTPARDVTVYLSMDLYSKVDNKCAQEDVARSHFIERVLSEYFERNESSS